MVKIKFLWIGLVLVLSIQACSSKKGKQEKTLNIKDQLYLVKKDTFVIAATKNRVKVANNPYRPLYHFSSPMNRIHDPNGICQWKGNYHMFYQYKANKTTYWGHTYSKDLLHWVDLPIALKPTIDKEGPSGHCFSGQTLVEENRVIAHWYGTKSGNRIATAEDPLLVDWKMHPNNPVIPKVKKNSKYRVYDPCIWKEKDGFYYALSGSYKDGKFRVSCTGEVHIFKSKDLSEWEWLGDMYTESDPAKIGEDIACPNFWPIGNGKHMLLTFSHKRAGRAYVGTFDLKTARFKPDYHFRENHGQFKNAALHAPSATVDEKGRYLGIFNTIEAHGMVHKGWDEIMTLPRVYSLASDNSIRINPIDEMKSIRFKHKSITARDMPSDKEEVLNNVSGRSMELKLAINPNEAKEVGVNVFRSEDGTEFTRIGYTSNGEIFIDRMNSSKLKKIKKRDIETAKLDLKPGETLELNIFIDQSIIEVFANGKLTLTKRAYPSKDNASTVSLYSKGGDAELKSMDAWQMHSVWPELKFKEGK